jgi:hypothetical protein
MSPPLENIRLSRLCVNFDNGIYGVWGLKRGEIRAFGKIWTKPHSEAYLNDKRQEKKTKNKKTRLTTLTSHDRLLRHAVVPDA